MRQDKLPVHCTLGWVNMYQIYNQFRCSLRRGETGQIACALYTRVGQYVSNLQLV